MKKILFIFLITFFNIKAFADDKMDLGLEVFKNKAQCGSCHALKAADSEGEIGPSLDMIKPQVDQIIYVVTNGVGVMPAWNGVLTTKEMEAVAFYIFNSTSK